MLFRKSILFYSCAVLLSLSMGTLIAAEKNLQDSDITAVIESEFLFDRVVDMNAIDVETRKGVVSLSGTVDNLLVKERAKKITAGIKGVRSIVDRTVVGPSIDVSDDKVREAVKAALLKDPAADSYEVDVSVEDGVVTLSGTVQSWAEKQLCKSVAMGVKGVREIKNTIMIEYGLTRTDAEIKSDIKQRLINDVHVDGHIIDVTVDDGRVKLSGTVAGLIEKNRAEADAWVAGVKSVNTDDLEIVWWVENEIRRRNQTLSRTDMEIQEAVTDAFVYDPRVLSFDIDVTVESGTATLTGIVDNLAAKKAAEQDARNTMGVWRVKNYLKVRPRSVPPNEELEKRVRDQLAMDPFVNLYDVHIDAENGLVYLSGRVNNSYEKNHAEFLTQNVKGVTSIVNNIDFDYTWKKKSDRVIEQNVKDQLLWSLFVNDEDIHVAVDDGIVTLTGKVDNWSELNAAEQNAFKGGAKDVINRLVVRYRYYGPSYSYDILDF